MNKEKELNLFYRQAAEVNRRLRKYGEEIPPSEELFKAFLAGTLDRLVSEGRLSVAEAAEIEGLMDGVYDPFALQMIELGLLEHPSLADGRERN